MDSQKDIYNPWSILNFLDTGGTAAYWANTSSNGLVNKLLREAEEEADLKETVRSALDQMEEKNTKRKHPFHRDKKLPSGKIPEGSHKSFLE